MRFCTEQQPAVEVIQNVIKPHIDRHIAVSEPDFSVHASDKPTGSIAWPLGDQRPTIGSGSYLCVGEQSNKNLKNRPPVLWTRAATPFLFMYRFAAPRYWLELAT